MLDRLRMVCVNWIAARNEWLIENCPEWANALELDGP